ncbi:calmodulin-binding receptor-like cytoplasmic kinase 2 [Dorcoceras hygrometricum]|uniref:Calmodulin-binding receptor-like cytoplasmic kinase 2 n=1 Tax=Dorcoceras hygrometricum TaxID=472368 RepID=A0A2Z7C399_9LAMI|nr:calmodulin-binding receptor-like cytoplasmic kinase 2 [Dorcoceras hygrometricum]
MLMAILVKADLGPSIKLHAKKVLTRKQVENYIKSNQGATDPNMPNPKKRKHKGGGKKTQTKPVATQVTTLEPQTIATQTVENRGTVAPTNFDSEEDSEPDSCQLVQRRCQKKQVFESSDSEATNSMPLMHFLKIIMTQRQHQQSSWTGVTIATQPDPIPSSTTDPEEIPDDQEITTDSRDGSHHDSIPLVPTEGEGNIVDDEQLDTGSHESAKIVSAQNVQMKADPASVDEYCQLLITSARNKLLELELEKLYLAHLAKFKTGVTSVNHDFECIRRLHKELRLIAAAHRHYRGLVGLPFITPAFSYSESDSLPKLVPTLELDSLAGYEQDTAQTMDHQIEQPGNEDTVMRFHEHRAQETEPTSQRDEHQNEGDEPQAAAELRSVPGIDHNLEDRNVVTPLAHIASDHRDPDSSNLQLDMSTRVSSLDLSYARLRDDTVITKRHTAQLCDQLKTTADGLDIEIDVLERTLTQRMVDELAVVKSQLDTIVEGLKETGAAKKGESGPSSRPREGTSGGGPSSHGGRGRSDNPGDPNNRFRYTKWF